jgi:hypothetical protein
VQKLNNAKGQLYTKSFTLPEDKSKLFLFVDYELKNQHINGINVIEKSGMQERHLLMTSKY